MAESPASPGSLPGSFESDDSIALAEGVHDAVTSSVGWPEAGVEWTALHAAAIDAMGRAYAPYSNFPVGAAGLVDDGRMVVGCNVENASYGLGLCAECGLVSDLVASGGGRLVAVVCVDRSGARLMPCGRCRQLLWEHGGPECLLDSVSGVRPLREVLPDAFGPEDLRTR